MLHKNLAWGTRRPNVIAPALKASRCAWLHIRLLCGLGAGVFFEVPVLAVCMLVVYLGFGPLAGPTAIGPVLLL